MAGGSAIEVFTDFMLSTGPAFLRGPEDIVNDAVKNTWTLPRFIYGKSMKDMIQGGNSIKDNIFLGADSNAANYKPNAEFTYRNPQVLTQWSIPWRFTKDEMVWTDHEIGLNTGELSRGARFHKYKTLKYSKEQNLYTGLLTFVDDQFWAPPDTTEMEGTDGETPYGIPCYITENGASGEVSTGTIPLNGPDATAWTTIMGIDPTVKTGWQNAAIQYASIGQYVEGTTTSPHIFKAFSRAYYKVRYDRLPRRSDLSDPTSVPHFFGASLTGISTYEEALRSNQDSFVWTGRQDPAFAGPQFRGIEMVYISDLDTAALFPGTDGALAVETAATNTGSRYFGVNGAYMLKVIHRNRYFYKKRPFSPSKQPYTHIMIVDIWHNNPCRSRRRQVIVYPNTDL